METENVNSVNVENAEQEYKFRFTEDIANLAHLFIMRLVFVGEKEQGYWVEHKEDNRQYWLVKEHGAELLEGTEERQEAQNKPYYIARFDYENQIVWRPMGLSKELADATNLLAEVMAWNYQIDKDFNERYSDYASFEASAE